VFVDAFVYEVAGVRCFTRGLDMFRRVGIGLRFRVFGQLRVLLNNLCRLFLVVFVALRMVLVSFGCFGEYGITFMFYVPLVFPRVGLYTKASTNVLLF